MRNSELCTIEFQTHITMKQELIDKITEMVFYLGSEVNESNARVVAGFVNTLYEIREHLKSEVKL